MIRNYFITAIRSLLKNKLYLFINAFSLAIAMAVCWFIISYTSFEESYDSHYTNVEQIYRVQHDIYRGNELMTKNSRTPLGLYRVIKDEIPGVEEATSIFYEEALIFTERATLGNQKFYWADSTFFEIFDVPFVYGTPKNALVPMHSIVISEKVAKTLYGDINPVGKPIYFNEHLPFTVTGVFKDLPPNSNIKFEVLATLHTCFYYGWMPESGAWPNSYMHTWIKTNKTLTQDKLSGGLEGIADKYMRFENRPNQLHKLYGVNAKQIHFKQDDLVREVEPTVNAKMLLMLRVVALLVLIIAFVNVLNYVIARAIERLNESGVRKVNGAKRLHIMAQFSIEIYMVLLFCVLISVGFYFAGATMFSGILDIPFASLFIVNIKIVVFTIVTIIAIATFISALTVLLTGAYQLHDVLKGKIGQSIGEIRLRKALVIFQFASTIVLFISLATIFKQINYMRNADMGIDKHKVFAIKAPYSLNLQPGRRQAIETFKRESRKKAGVEQVAYSFQIPGKLVESNTFQVSTSKNAEQQAMPLSIIRAGQHYFDVYDIDIITGRTFRSDTSEPNCLLLNESAVKTLDFESGNTIGQQVRIGNITYKIIGIVEDFHQNGLQYRIEPTVFVTRAPRFWGYFSVKMDRPVNAATLKSFETMYKSHFPNDPFEYYLLNELFDIQYKPDIRNGQILGAFSIVILIISSLGIFGMTIYFTNRRIKEIGVRKAIGARIIDIIALLNKDIVLWISISFVVACPIAWLAMRNWLNNFAYKTTMDWWLYVATGGGILLISILTVSYQSIKTALCNPVKALRYE